MDYGDEPPDFCINCEGLIKQVNQLTNERDAARAWRREAESKLEAKTTEERPVTETLFEMRLRAERAEAEVERLRAERLEVENVQLRSRAHAGSEDDGRSVGARGPEAHRDGLAFADGATAAIETVGEAIRQQRDEARSEVARLRAEREALERVLAALENEAKTQMEIVRERRSTEGPGVMHATEERAQTTFRIVARLRGGTP